jgi:hypothetical protein
VQLRARQHEGRRLARPAGCSSAAVQGKDPNCLFLQNQNQRSFGSTGAPPIAAQLQHRSSIIALHVSVFAFSVATRFQANKFVWPCFLMMLKQDQPLRVGIAAVGTFLVACFLTFAISPLLVRSKVRCNPLTHRYCAAFEIADTADAIVGHSSFSVVSFATLPAITASERSCMIRDAAHIATSASSQLVSLNLSRQLPAVAMLL